MDPALVGRDEELQALRDVLQVVRRRREGRIAIVEGEVGIGKTRLLAEALAGENVTDLMVMRAGADELGREQPFGLLAEALEIGPDATDPEAVEIARLIAGPGAGDVLLQDAPDVRFRVVERLLALVERLAYESPLVLALDDLHWADPSTLLTLHRLARRLPDVPLALLGSCRPHPRPRELAAVLDAIADSGVHVRLRPLAPDDAQTLGTALLGAEPGPGLLSQMAGAEGNPLFVVELIGALQDEGSIEPIDGRAEVPEASLPPSLRLTILRRLSFLRDDVLDVLGPAAVLGSSFSVADLAVALERSIAQLLPLLREAIDAEVLRGEGNRLRFRHDLVRECVYTDLPVPLRAALHLQAARAFAGAGRPAAQVATHFALGAPHADREAVEWLRRAAAETASRAPGVAAEFLQRAVELLPDDDTQRPDLDFDLVRTLLWSGKVGEAEQLARRLLARSPDAKRATALHYAIGRALSYRGRLADSIDHLEQALRDGAGSVAADRPRLLAELSHRRLLSGDLAGSERAAQEAGERGDRVARWTGLCALAWVAAARGELGRADELAEAAVAEADEEAGDPMERIQPGLYRAFVKIQRDMWAEAEPLLRDGLALAGDIGATWALPLHHAGLAILHWHTGAWDDALAEAETSLELADELDVRVWTPAAHGLLASIAFHRDDFARAAAVVREAASEPVSRNVLFFADRLALTEALLAEAAAEAPAALDRLTAHWRRVRAGGSVGEWRETAPHLVRLAVAANDRDLATEVTAAAENVAAGSELDAAAGVAILCRGLLEADAALLARSAEALRASARPLESALSAEAAALALAAHDGERAVESLREALAGYERLGATHGAARIEAELRRHGVRRGRRGSRRRPEQGWESLTPSEQRIASLLAEGLTNPQIAERLFLSRRTVETHVSHALRKLGVSSRVQLATEATRRQALPGPAPRTAP